MLTNIHHSIGHSLYTFGALLLLFSVTILSPLNLYSAQAIGAQELIDLTNQTRSEFGVADLNVNSTLMSAAQMRAEDMAKKQFFAHFGPDGSTPWQYFNDAGYSYEVAGENLAITNEDDMAVHQGWLNSPTHKENLISPQYSDIGIGIAYFGTYQGNNETTIIVALYGSPKRSLAVTGPAQTNPAGTVAALQPRLLGIGPYNLAAIAVAMIIGGIALEVRHIKRNHSKSSTL